MGRILIVIIGLAMMAASPAMACRMLEPSALGLHQYETVLLASVVEAERVENPGWYTWRITAQTIQTIGGDQTTSRHTFTSTLYSIGCARSPMQAPPAGERWVLYLTPSDTAPIIRAFPLDYVRDHDPRLANLP